jgi:Cu/Ag efflux protein CusF
MRIVAALALATALVALVVAPAMAQTQTAPPPRPAAPATVPEKPTTKEVEGTVKKVDAAAKSVQVSSGLLGIFGATVNVTDETKINVQGKEGALTDIREGAKVKAAYESRDGKNMAKTIDVLEEPKAPAGQKPPSQ